MGRLSWSDVKENIYLLSSGVRRAFRSDASPVIAVLLHELTDVPQGAVEFVESVKFAELELRRIDDLVIVRMAGRAFHVNGSDEEIERSGECEPYSRAGGTYFGLDVRETPGSIEDADAVTNLVALERFARFLWEHLQQVLAIRNARQFDGLDDASCVSRHRGES